MRLLKIPIGIACIAFSVVVGISRCTTSPVAGWGSETTNGVVACIVNAGGSPAAYAKVHLRRGDYLTPTAPSAKSAIIGAEALTDAQGRFEIIGMDTGAFSIEINDGRSALLFTCFLTDHDTVNLGIDTLRPYASVSGSMDSAAGPAYVRVSGLERLVQAGSDGRYAITDLPQGALNIHIMVNPGAQARSLEILNVKTIAGRTTAVSFSVNWPWSRRLYLNTAAAGVAEDVGHFPLLIRLDSSNFDFTQINGASPAFMFAKEDLSPLPYEIASFDKQAKRAVIWVAMDTIYGSGAAQYFTMSWNGSAQGLPAAATVFDTAQGYSGVWHLEENGSGVAGEFRDATSFGSSGAGGNGVAAQTPSRFTGVAGSAQMFDGSNDFIQTPGQKSLDFTDQLMVSFWVYYDSIQPYNARIISKDMDWEIKIASGRPQISMGGAYYVADASFQLHAWNQVTITLTGLSGTPVAAIYLNGSLSPAFENTFPDSFTVANRNFSGDLFFGQLGDNAFFLHGAIDEIWLQRSVRSAAWIALLYANQRQGGSLAGLAP